MTVTMGSSTRDRLLDAATELALDGGWPGVTMNKIACKAGVSRQTVYNEIGSKPILAQQLVARELSRFLDEVVVRIGQSADPIDAVSGAALVALTRAENNAFLRLALDATYGGNADLLPLLTLDSAFVLDEAYRQVRTAFVAAFPTLGIPDEELRLTLQTLVRLVFSHILQPTDKPELAAADLAFVLRAMLTTSLAAV